MKKIVEMKIKTDDIDAKKFASKIKDIVDELNEETIDDLEDINYDDIKDIVINMYEKGYSLKEVMEITNLSASKIASIIEEIDLN